MNAKQLNKIFTRAMYSMVIVAMVLSVSTVVYAAPNSPFVGKWEAIDVDGSNMNLAIGGPANGPFQITWTDDYISYCNGEAGIIRGTGLFNVDDSNLMVADLYLKCLTIGETLNFQLTFRFHPTTNTMSFRYENGAVVIWHRPGGGQVEEPPGLSLRVNYGHDWVESFYEGGHTAWIMVTDGDGNLKATAELITEPKDYWGWEEGFQTGWSDWVDAEGNSLDSPPDIQPYDWVYGWVDNGAGAQVQIGDIGGMIDLVNDSISGMIIAPWFSDPVQVECLDWGSGQEPPFDNKDGGFVFTDGEDSYSCSWAEEWDIQPGQDVGVGYSGPDGNWVANAFVVTNPTFGAYVPGAIEGYDWPMGSTITIDINDGEYTAQALSEQRPDSPEGDTRVLFELWRDNISLKAGDYILMTDGSITKDTVVTNLAVTGFDLSARTVSGLYDPAYDLLTWLYDGDGQVPEMDPGTGTWVATFSELPLGAWGGATQWDEDGDGTSIDFQVPNTRFTVWPEWNYLEGYEWPDGAVVSISVDGKDACSTEAVSGYPEWDPSNTFFSLNFLEGCAIEVGDFITLSYESLSLTHQVQALVITDVDLDFDTVVGMAVFDPEQYLLHTWIHGIDESYMQLSMEGGNWLADFGSQGIDLQPGMGGRVEVVDQASNATAVDWYVPNPHFSAFPEWEYLEGYEWPDGALVSISVDGKEICSTSATAGYPEWDPNNTFLGVNFPEGCDLAIGDVVTASDGVTTRTHTVRNLAISSVDEVADTVAGMSDPDEMIYVWPHETGQQIEVAVDEYGSWLADFNGIYDIQSGSGGRSEIRDEVGNATAVDWYIPNPLITVFPESEYIQGYDWPDGATVTITVEGKPVCFLERDSWGGFFDGNFPEGCDLVTGDTVTFTDGATSRTHIVRNLAITGVDMVTDTVAGTADIGDVVSVGAYDFGGESELWLTVEDGSWLADFASKSIDLVEGMCGYSRIYDDIGNWTQVDWCISNPRFTIFPEWEWFDGYDWPDGATVSITVDGKLECDTTSQESWGGFFNGGFPEYCDIAIGDVVTFTDNVTTRTHTVRNLAITTVDQVYESVSGTSDPYEIVYVWQHEPGPQLPFEADENGEWFADLNGVYDIRLGAGGRSEIRDEFGNSTAVDWYIPSPSFTVFPEETYLAGVNWLEGGTVSITVAGKEICSTEVVPGFYPDWDPSHLWFYADFPEGCTIEAGNLVTLSDGTTTQTHTVGNLAVTEVNADTDTVAGTAVFDPEQYILETWIHNVGGYMQLSAEDGSWRADFGSQGFDLQPGMGGRIQLTDQNSNVTAIDWNVLEPPHHSRTLEAGNFYVEWSNTNPEEVTYLSWKGSENLTNSTGDLEFFGNSWVSENEGTDDFFFASLVGWCTTGTWEGTNSSVNINSISSGCPGSADIPVNTQYQFIESKPDLIMIQRTIEFGDTAYLHDVKPFIPRLYPWDGFTQVLHPNATSTVLVTEDTSTICDFGWVTEDWDGSWFAIQNPYTGVGMIVQSASDQVALWLDNDGASFTNSSSILLLQPDGGFAGTVTETEYLCFYDSGTWTPSLTLPEGCQP